jgi:hypothetical protein
MRGTLTECARQSFWLVGSAPIGTCFSSSRTPTSRPTSKSCSQIMGKKSALHQKIFADEDRWSSICRGATLWGLEHSEKYPSATKTVTSRIARYSYGVKCSQLFDETKGHSIRDRRRGVRGEWRADNQMHWLLEKGDKVEEGRLLNVELSANVQVGLFSKGMEYFSDTLFFCADDEPPSRGEISKCSPLRINQRRTNIFISGQRAV